MRSEPVSKMTLTMWMPVIKSLNKIIGLIVMIVLANLWSNHLQQLHENDMWFSNIEVSISNFYVCLLDRRLVRCLQIYGVTKLG